jgi:hypothetical protein
MVFVNVFQYTTATFPGSAENRVTEFAACGCAIAGGFCKPVFGG